MPPLNRDGAGTSTFRHEQHSGSEVAGNLTEGNLSWYKLRASHHSQDVVVPRKHMIPLREVVLAHFQHLQSSQCTCLACGG